MSNENSSTPEHPVNAPDGTPVPYATHVPTHRDAEPISDPGLPAHTWRPTDVDPKAEKRAERQIAAMFIAAMVCAVLFVVAYFSFEVGDNWDTFAGLGASTITLGLTLGLSLLLIGTGIIHLARKLMADHEMVEMRHPAASPQEDRDATVQALNDGLAESGIGRRPLVRNTMLGAIAVLGLPAIVLLRDLAPGNALDVDKLGQTIWEPGMRLVRDVVGTPILASEIEIGDLINAAPEAMFPTEENGYPELDGAEEQAEKAKGAIIIVRMDPDDIIPLPGREKWTVDGIISLLEDLHPRGLPDLPLRAHHPPRAVPLPPVDLRPRRPREGHLRSGCPPPPPAAPRGGRRGLPGRTERLQRAHRG